MTTTAPATDAIYEGEGGFELMSTNYLHVTGPLTCIRCSFTTQPWHDTGADYKTQAEVMTDHLNAEHPNWQTVKEMDRLNTVVVKRYARSDEGQEPELALVVSSCSAPTFGLISARGDRYDWRQDLTRPATPEEALRYWRQRAEAAEEFNEKLRGYLDKSQDINSKLCERLTRDIEEGSH